MTIRPVAIALIAGLTGLGSGPALAQSTAVESVIERDVVDMAPPKGSEIERVEIDNRLGDVRVEGHDQDSITIQAVKRARDQETLERLKVSLVPDPNGTISIRTALLAGREAKPIAAGSIRIDLVIRAPRSARIEARTWKGLVAAKGLDNGAELFADRGDIEVSQVSGQVSTESSHGRHRFAEVFGTIDARALEGDLDLDLIRGEHFAARVQRGEIHGRRMRVKNMMVRVMRGDVHLEAEHMLGGSMRVSSYWGNVNVRLHGRVPARVAAHSRKGRVALSSTFRQKVADNGTVTGELGTGRSPAELDLRTRVGSITVAEF